MRKGILLAGGTASRLYPCSKIISKHLLPVYDKPLVYYPLSTLMLSGIRDILVICTERDIYQYQNLFNDGSYLGLKISYAIQNQPNGIAECFLIAKDFIGSDDVCLILGDNIFYGNNLTNLLQKAYLNNGCTLFAYHCLHPERFGVLEIKNHKPISIIEKPIKAPSNYAITGLYFYDNSVINYIQKIKPSHRNELEITDINNIYITENKINIEFLNRGIGWIDAGTPESLLEASTFVGAIQKRSNTIICCPEEIAYKKEWISKEDLKNLIKIYSKSDYTQYLQRIIDDEYIDNR